MWMSKLLLVQKKSLSNQIERRRRSRKPSSVPCHNYVYYCFHSDQLSSLNGQSLYNIYPVKGSKAFTIYIFASCVVIKLAVQPTLFNIWSPNSTDTFICICQNSNTKATAGHSANIFVHAFIFVSCAAIKLRVNLTLFFVDGKRFPVWPDWLQLPSLLLAHAQLHSILKYLKSNTEWPDQFWHPSRSHAQPPHSITSKPQYEVFTN